MNQPLNVDPQELAKFSELAHRWWDPHSEFKPLARHQSAAAALDRAARQGLAGKRVLDVGCGGGILSEAMAEQGAEVTGIDLSDKALSVARCTCWKAAARSRTAKWPWKPSRKRRPRHTTL